ncbi:MAG: molybdenum cofactor guanylyltransferase [Solirubrobacteraceae bacterium]
MLTPPFGVVLAGGAATRLPGKPLLELRGRPLISYPLGALHELLEDVVVVAKVPLPGLRTWVEPAQPQHPLCGILHALRSARGRAVLVCAADMPAIEAGELRLLVAARRLGTKAIVPRAGGRLQPLCALYEAAALRSLEGAPAGAPLTATVLALEPLVLERADARPYLNVNTPVELERLSQT